MSPWIIGPYPNLVPRAMEVTLMTLWSGKYGFLVYRITSFCWTCLEGIALWTPANLVAELYAYLYVGFNLFLFWSNFLLLLHFHYHFFLAWSILPSCYNYYLEYESQQGHYAICKGFIEVSVPVTLSLGNVVHQHGWTQYIGSGRFDVHTTSQ